MQLSTLSWRLLAFKKKRRSQVEVLWFGFFNMDCSVWLTTATERASEELSSNWRCPNTELNLLRGLSPQFLEESAQEKLRIALPPKMAAVLLCAILHTAFCLVSEYVVGNCLCCLSTGHCTVRTRRSKVFERASRIQRRTDQERK